MRVAFRTDASAELGTGHVMRCSSLARGLREKGHAVTFICADEPGNMIAWICQAGFEVVKIHPASQQEDCRQTRTALEPQGADWLVVDHYRLDRSWEEQVAGSADRLMVLDDMGRPHACDLLLDQNYDNPLHARYLDNLPTDCELLLGPRFALVREEFAQLRDQALLRRDGRLSQILLFMSGSDEYNETGKALAGIAASRYREVPINVAIGAANPNRAAIDAAMADLPGGRLYVQTPQMAELMLRADLMICAGGSANWERCTLGLPALLTILAENQVAVAEGLGKAGAQKVLGWYDRLQACDYAVALDKLDRNELYSMSAAAAAVCDGRGVEAVISRLDNLSSGDLP